MFGQNVLKSTPAQAHRRCECECVRASGDNSRGLAPLLQWSPGPVGIRRVYARQAPKQLQATRGRKKSRKASPSVLQVPWPPACPHELLLWFHLKRGFISAGHMESAKLSCFCFSDRNSVDSTESDLPLGCTPSAGQDTLAVLTPRRGCARALHRGAEKMRQGDRSNVLITWPTHRSVSDVSWASLEPCFHDIH